MENIDTLLASGAKLHITVASFADALNLRKALLKCVKGLEIGEDIFEKNVTALKDTVISMMTSDEVEQAVFKCLERVTYEGVKITKDLFDDPQLGEKLRADFDMICWEVVKANVMPFFVQTFSKLKNLLNRNTQSPESPSPLKVA